MSTLLSKVALFPLLGFCSAGVAFSPTFANANEVQYEVRLAQTNQAAEAEGKSIVDVAGGNESFQTLVAAVKAAGLADTLAGEGPFTVLAPPDSAFEELPPGALDALLKPENKDLLVDILTYHVIPKEMKFNEFRSGGLATLNGGVAVQLTSERIIINNASIIQADVEADNGIIQVVSRVLLPSGAAEQLQALLPEEATPAQPAAAMVETEASDGDSQPAVRGLW